MGKRKVTQEDHPLKPGSLLSHIALSGNGLYIVFRCEFLEDKRHNDWYCGKYYYTLFKLSDGNTYIKNQRTVEDYHRLFVEV